MEYWEFFEKNDDLKARKADLEKKLLNATYKTLKWQRNMKATEQEIIELDEEGNKRIRGES